MKGRKIWGALVPLDKPWRTGANAATKLTASREFTFGDKKIPAGSYALYTIPGKTTWTVALNSKTDAPAALPPDPKTDVARITVKPEAMPAARERLAFVFSNATDDAATLDLEWEKVRLRIPLKVDTKAHTAAGIEKALAEAWRPHFVAARWELESGDPAKALAWANTSIAVKPTWWNHWVKAQVLAKQGKKADAIATATEAEKLGKGDPVYDNFFKDPIAKAIAGWK